MSAPGTLGAVSAVTPTLGKHVVDGETLLVTLSLADIPDVLVMLARAITRPVAFWYQESFRILGREGVETEDGRLALAGLLAAQQVRDALTITLRPNDADQLGEALQDAAREDYCPIRSCDRLAHPDRNDHYCDQHGAAHDETTGWAE